APFRAIDIRDIIIDNQLTCSNVKFSFNRFCIRIDHIDFRRHFIIVATRRNIQIPISISLQPVKIWRHLDPLYFFKTLNINNRNSTFVIWRTVAARVCYIELVSDGGQLFRLATYLYTTYYLQASGIDFCHNSIGCIRISHLPQISTYIGFALMKSYVTTIYDIDLSEFFGCVLIQNLDLIGVIDHYV